MTQQKNEMPEQNFLLTKWFWILFTIAVILGLYLYGLKMIGDKTEIAQTKKLLQESEQELSNCTSENNSKANTIVQLNRTNSEQNNTISEQAKIVSEKEQTIQELQNKVTELENRPPKVVIKYQDRTVYKVRAVPMGRGKMP